MTEQSDLAGRLVETAAEALWDGGGRGLGFAHLAGGTQKAYRADAADVLAAVLPLLADEIDGFDFGTAPDGLHPGSFIAGSVMAKLCAVGHLRGLAAEVAR